MTAMDRYREREERYEAGLSVSVVVPTRNRPVAVANAVRSALGQSYPPVEVVVVVDGPDPETVRALKDIADARVVIRELAHNVGPARARNLGVGNCKGGWVAFLDDDDEWSPNKLRKQVDFASSQASVDKLVVATGVERRRESDSDWWPVRSPSPNELVGDYLFVRRQPGEGFLQTSTIMLRRDFAQSCPMPEHLRLHEDYDWFIDLEKAGARFTVILEPLVVFNARIARTSLSTNARWDTSLAWVLSRRSDLSERAFSGFCLTEVARSAADAGDFRAVLAIFTVAFTGTISWFAGARFIVIWLLPIRIRRKLSTRVGILGRRS